MLTLNYDFKSTLNLGNKSLAGKKINRYNKNES